MLSLGNGTPCITCVQYRGVPVGGYHDACGGSLEYHGGVQYRGDVLSTMGVFSTVGECTLSTVGDIMIYVGIS